MSTDASHTENGQTPLILIHGAWLSARSWENYLDYFGSRGFAVSAPEWPRKQGDVEELRESTEASAGLGVQEIVDHYERLIGDLDLEPQLHDYKRYQRSPARTDYLEFEGRPPLHMVAPDWQEVAGAINSWLGGVLDVPVAAMQQAS